MIVGYGDEIVGDSRRDNMVATVLFFVLEGESGSGELFCSGWT